MRRDYYADPRYQEKMMENDLDFLIEECPVDEIEEKELLLHIKSFSQLLKSFEETCLKPYFENKLEKATHELERLGYDFFPLWDATWNE